jgi:hypothetical protein
MCQIYTSVYLLAKVFKTSSFNPLDSKMHHNNDKYL